MKHPVRTGTMIALAAASLFTAACKQEQKPEPTSAGSKPATDTKAPTAAPAASADKTAKVHCQGANACKGQSGCQGAANACAGQNGCKGKSFVETATAEECAAKGGTVVAGSM